MGLSDYYRGLLFYAPANGRGTAAVLKLIKSTGWRSVLQWDWECVDSDGEDE